jgi:hypothetical protein
VRRIQQDARRPELNHEGHEVHEALVPAHSEPFVIFVPFVVKQKTSERYFVPV